ncbi:unnamed protein product [Rotaria magnacalcarata]|uniref:Uncharacterized protein n=5 Tax=Rotaria magnacalcarata TaxID=392030 RepID=A0A819UVI0_9BILA|nr:unnamed protein product [Rotaria magnacalcarata]CAF4098879.1 unnamed protein product [Rotaria magnacalcarata]
MVSCKILYVLRMLLTFGLSSASSLPTCFISTPFVGEWIQPGLADSITINNTSCSLKGTCIATIGHQDVKNKFIFYNEQTRCKRCVLFISRHLNALQYRESECFDADDDDNTRICGSITPDTVLYTLFRENPESIPCPFDQSWHFEKTRQVSKVCHPKAFQHCLSSNTFEVSYNNQCQTNKNLRATCFARFTDGNINYVVARSNDRKRFVCFSYSKAKRDEQHTLPNEVYLSVDETCRDLLTRESAIVLNVLSDTYHRQYESKIQLPHWTQGKWLTIGTSSMNMNSVYINNTQLIIKINGDQTILHDLKLTRVIVKSRPHENNIRIKAKSFEQCSSILYCIQLTYRSPAVMDLSISFDENKCQVSHLHYTLFKPSTSSNISCPQMGIYSSSKTYRPLIPVSTCSTGVWTLSIGCETSNKSELTFSSACRHETVPDVQVITSIKGICLASWRSDEQFQRTIILYEQTRAFCLIQPLKPKIASWILSESSCTDITVSSINVENSLSYSDNCQHYIKSSEFLTTNNSSIERISYLLFSFLLVLLLCKY